MLKTKGVSLEGTDDGIRIDTSDLFACDGACYDGDEIEFAIEMDSGSVYQITFNHSGGTEEVWTALIEGPEETSGDDEPIVIITAGEKGHVDCELIYESGNAPARISVDSETVSVTLLPRPVVYDDDTEEEDDSTEPQQLQLPFKLPPTTNKRPPAFSDPYPMFKQPYVPEPIVPLGPKIICSGDA